MVHDEANTQSSLSQATVGEIVRERQQAIIERDRCREALEELATWVRLYAIAHDFQQYPAALMDAEDVLYQTTASEGSRQQGEDA